MCNSLQQLLHGVPLHPGVSEPKIKGAVTQLRGDWKFHLEPGSSIYVFSISNLDLVLVAKGAKSLCCLVC